jgi:hypothetical protein
MRALYNHVVERPVTLAATRTLVKTDTGGVFKLNLAAGSTITLPASTGDGWVATFVVAGVSTGSYIVKVANTNDIIQGSVTMARNDATGTTVSMVTSTATIDTITLNAGTSGGVRLGETFQIIDLESGTFVVSGQLMNSGTATTPFSASV